MSGAPACPILVLRPQPGNSETVARLTKLGVEAIAMPLFAIEPVDGVLPQLDDIDALLLTSANAVRHAGKLLSAAIGVPVWCVGEATAAAARAAGLSVERVGRQGVAALLSDVSHRLLWLCGEERTRLAPYIERQITAIPVYRTVYLPLEPQGLQRACVAMLHSSRAARRLAAIAPERSAIALVTISAEVAAAAGTGWRRVAVAAQPDDAEMVAIAAGLCQDRGQRGAA